MQNIAAQFTF